MAMPDVVRWVFDYLSLQPQQVVLHGWIWQLVTYSFIHAGFWHWFGNMIGIWMFGSAFEGSWGTRRFLELYSFGVVGAALTTIALSFAHALGRPDSITVGASGGVFAILIAFGMVFGENDILMIPFPVSLKAKYFLRLHLRQVSGAEGPSQTRHLRALLRHAQWLLPLEETPGSAEVRSLYAQA
jgi:membrane associated rhomboid family serine protease